MNGHEESLAAIKDIRKIMERSSKFVSLSGLSGVAAGICALAGAYFASQKLDCWIEGTCNLREILGTENNYLVRDLFYIAAATFAAALLSSFLFTWLRSKKNNAPLWGSTTLRLFWNFILPLLAGGLFLARMIQMQEYELVAPGCLIFYGLALVNASKYTLGEIRFLGYGQIILGIINLWMIGYGLYFWAAGFGILHIVYGIIMWWKYERSDAN